jgi:hypothetical protein
MEMVQTVVSSLFKVDSIWSVIFRGVIWFVVSIVIIMSVDSPDMDKSLSNMKANLGFFFVFLILGTGLTMLLFGYKPA